MFRVTFKVVSKFVLAFTFHQSLTMRGEATDKTSSKSNINGLKVSTEASANLFHFIYINTIRSALRVNQYYPVYVQIYWPAAHYNTVNNSTADLTADLFTMCSAGTTVTLQRFYCREFSTKLVKFHRPTNLDHGPLRLQGYNKVCVCMCVFVYVCDTNW